jgi:hypothetical protein
LVQIASDEVLRRRTIGYQFANVLPEAASKVEKRLPGLKTLLEMRVGRMKTDAQV